MNRILMFAMVAVLGLASVAVAETPPAGAPAPAAPAAPAPAAPAEKALVAVVKSVQGTVETRPAVGQPWVPVQVGMKLAEGADLRTGFRAVCVLDMTDSLIQVDPLSLIRIAELRAQGNQVRTRIHMKQGNTQAVVEKVKIQSDFAIVTPSATLSVRGTEGIGAGYYPAFGGQFGLAGPGLIAVRDVLIGRQILVRPGENTNDMAMLPIQFLYGQFIPIILDRNGLDVTEQFAAMRWNTSLPLPAGLNGPGGPPSLAGLTGNQQTPPGESIRDFTDNCDGGIIDPTLPPRYRHN